MRIGVGYDSHRFVEGRKLIIGGIEIPFEKGLSGHSDADVLCHAITDAIIGALGMGDIGTHFPDTDLQWKDSVSIELLKYIVEIAGMNGYMVAWVDTIIITESTKVNELMREFDDYSNLAQVTPQGQLVQIIPPMQEVRRRAESQKVPQCLTNLQDLQVAHMNTVIETLMAFMGNPQAEVVNLGIAQARDLHMKYDIEMARLLGV